jgi:hypothetical protein
MLFVQAAVFTRHIQPILAKIPENPIRFAQLPQPINQETSVLLRKFVRAENARGPATEKIILEMELPAPRHQAVEIRDILATLSAKTEILTKRIRHTSAITPELRVHLVRAQQPTSFLILVLLGKHVPMEAVSQMRMAQQQVVIQTGTVAVGALALITNKPGIVMIATTVV